MVYIEYQKVIYLLSRESWGWGEARGGRPMNTSSDTSLPLTIDWSITIIDSPFDNITQCSGNAAPCSLLWNHTRSQRTSLQSAISTHPFLTHLLSISMALPAQHFQLNKGHKIQSFMHGFSWSAGCFQVSPATLPVSVLHSSAWPNNILLGGYITCS